MKALTVTPRSATFELESDSVFYSEQEYEIYLNDELVRRDNRNVFSLFGLQPDTAYEVRANCQKLSFKTGTETAVFNVKHFNAAGDGVHDDTPAFCAALATLPYGGTLYVPQGTYFLTPLFIKSGVTLYLEKGAVLLGSPNRNDYPVLPALLNTAQGELNLGTWQGEEAPCFASLIYSYGQKDIKIIGEGIVDCNALAGDWYINHRVMRTAWRPRGMFFNNCRGILLQGVTVKDTPSWNIHSYFCKDVDIFDVNLKNTPSMPTTDGIDPDCCDGVRIMGVQISVGDDCIALKSGTVDFAKKYRRPCKNVTIKNCLMREGHGGVVLGSELSGGIENITVEKCLFIGTDRGLRIKTRRGRGRLGATDGITFKNIIMEGVKVPFVVNMYYNMGDENGHTEYVYTTKKLPVDDRTPYIGEFTFKDMRCTGVEYCAGVFYGLPEAPVKGVNFENVSFEYAENCGEGYPDMKEMNQKVSRGGLYFLYVDKVTLKNVSFCGQSGDAVICEGVDKLIEE